MKWTEKQSQVIEKRESNILVSAAAGSGKTAVLVERIKQLIIKDGVPIDEILVVTFTKAAASEMKEKIVKALGKEIIDHPENAKALKRQLDKLFRANISTFHAFAMEIVRKYFHLIDIDPGVKICDETQGTIMKHDALDEVFENYFEAKNQEFLTYLNQYALNKNENDLKESILRIYTEIQSMPEPFSWLEEQIKALDCSPEAFKNSKAYGYMQEDLQAALKEGEAYIAKAGEILSLCGLEKLAQKNEDDRLQIEALLEQENFSLLRTQLAALSFATMRAGKEEKEDYEEVKSAVSDLRKKGKDVLAKVKERYFAEPLEEQIALIRKTYPSAKFLKELLLGFHQAYGEKKREKNLVDFNDIEHFAIEILKNKEAAAEYREKFQYIFIDEYQDSNYLQEEIINQIKRENNLFMVGDIKQSIYRFRLAEPGIFKEKYERYKKSGKQSVKFDLNENFRSKKSIIDGVNDIFSGLMEDYTPEVALHLGRNDPRDIHYPVELHLVNGATELDEEIDETLLEMKKNELEALAACKLIEDAVGELFYDHKAEVERRLTKRDIVILMRGVKNTADIFYDVLKANNIQAYIDDNSGYFDTIEILTFLDLLRVINNKNQDIPLLSVLRSAIFGFTIDELIQIRLEHREGSYYEALTHYVQCGTKAALAEKISSVFTQISAWSREAIYTPLEDFVWMLMSQTGYYSYVGALPGGDQRQANLRTFVDKTLSFREGGSNSIFSLLRYIEAIGKKKIDIGQINLMSEKDDVVRIMTIHKSKGLEFPMVIVSGLGKRFNRDNRSKVGSMHKDIGFALSYVNHKDRWYKTTLLEQIIAAKKAAESLEEEIRVLYVAITRAKDKLVLMAGVNDLADRLEKYDQGVTGKSCFLDLIYPQLEKSQIEVFTHDRNSLGQYIQGSTGKEMVMASLLEDYAKNRNEQLKEQVHHLLSYRYPMEHELGVKSKFSVSELNYVTNQESRLKVALNEPEFTKEKRDFTGVEKGTLMHKVMEHLDFSAVYQHLLKSREEGFSYVSRFILSLVSQELLLPKEAEAIDRNKIMAFFDSPIGIRAAKAEKLYKEKAFNILHDHQGTEIIVQGIIDCYFEEKGELVLLDYKTNYATEEVRETYRAQIDLYKEALEKTEGKPVKEAYLYLFSKGRVEVM